MTLRWNCDDQGCYKNRLPDWGMLAGCFEPTRVRPMDVDGVVEQNGRCLFLEQKGPGGSLSEPQVRMFKMLASQGHTCIAFWIDRHEVVQSINIFGPGQHRGKEQSSLEDLRAAVHEWWLSVRAI